MSEPTLFQRSSEPLAARMRPKTLDEFLGQEPLVGPGTPLGELIRRGDVTSCIFWGPPGSGKTTLARLVAHYTDRHFEPFSAVTEGVGRVREIIKAAEERLQYEGRGTILFCDEIHRFNRAQQDAFLPWVESGTITLIGATTENPSFELTGALLSRCRVFVLEPLTLEHIKTVVRRALRDADRGLGSLQLLIEEDALALLAREADGDARRALQAVEAAAEYLTGSRSAPNQPLPPITAQLIADALQKRFAKYDKGGEEHYNLISALHKAVRGSDVEGALYWLARMLLGGEDPLYIARRLVRIAAEDVGLADPRALTVTLAAKDAYHFLGTPEGELALAEAVVYLATAPKSNRVYAAFDQASAAAKEHPAEPVPLHIRNAPTTLMKDLGYGAGYKYAHAYEDAYVPQDYLPPALRGQHWYDPTDFGFEKDVKKRMEWWAELKQRTLAGGEGAADR
ncbi:MAG TPA: replication-associated recombination protein A [Gemmatimonadales bacterium]|jgi:putative ATPase|nr:replication-associated recombination protein A [Gemmatimonadales bacterium]